MKLKMKNFLFWAGNCLCAAAMFFAVNSANGMCFWKSYQPKVPASLIKDDE